MKLGIMFFSSVDEHMSEGKYALVMDAVSYADAVGLSAVWTPERHFHRFGGLFPNPAVLSAAIAVRTRSIEIRAGSVISPLHHPVRIAEDWAVVDNLSRGRVSIAFGSGWNVDDFVLAPKAYADRRSIMLDQIDMVRRLWRGEALSLSTHNGREVAVQTRPRPAQLELPLWLTAGGTNDETFLAAAHIGAGVLTHLMSQDEVTLAGRIERYRAAGGNGPVALMLHCYVAPDGDDPRSVVRDPLREYLRQALDLDAKAIRATGRQVVNNDSLVEELLDVSVDRYIQQALIGSEATCGRRLLVLEEHGVDEVACLIDFGIDSTRVLASLERLASLNGGHRKVKS